MKVKKMDRARTKNPKPSYPNCHFHCREIKYPIIKGAIKDPEAEKMWWIFKMLPFR
jgi:hypothetical protein